MVRCLDRVQRQGRVSSLSKVVLYMSLRSNAFAALELRKSARCAHCYMIGLSGL
jgi:hypothetical protein